MKCIVALTATTNLEIEIVEFEYHTWDDIPKLDMEEVRHMLINTVAKLISIDVSQLDRISRSDIFLTADQVIHNPNYPRLRTYSFSVEPLMDDSPFQTKLEDGKITLKLFLKAFGPK